MVQVLCGKASQDKDLQNICFILVRSGMSVIVAAAVINWGQN